MATTLYVHQWVVNEHFRLSMGDRNELLDGPTKVVLEPSSMLTTGVDNRRPTRPTSLQGEKNTTSSFILTGGVNARVESVGVSGGTTSLSGNKLTLASYKHKLTSNLGTYFNDGRALIVNLFPWLGGRAGLEWNHSAGKELQVLFYRFIPGSRKKLRHGF